MREVRVESTVNCTTDDFWKLFFDRTFIEKLFLEGLKFETAEILDITDNSRRMRCKPQMNLPRALKKLVGDNFGYDESGELIDGVWRWTVTPNVMPDKVTNNGTVEVKPLGDDRCRRIDIMRVEAKVFGVGKLIESTSEQQVTDAWRKTERFTNEWIAKHGIGG